MTDRLIVHIGDPKTGSTSIQRTLFDKQWDCPTVSLGYPPVVSALALVSALKEEARPNADKIWTQTADWIQKSDAQVGVISAEQFAAVPPQDLNGALRKHLPRLAATAQIVAYVRPHVSRLLSSYAQRVKMGQLRKSMDTFGADPSQLLILQMHKRFSAWRDEFGDRFTLRPMVRSELRDGDVVADFLGLALDGAPFTLIGPTEFNVSMTAEALSGLQRFLAVLVRNDVEKVERHSIGSRISDLVSQQKTQVGTKLRVHRSLYEKLREHCMEDARNLDRDFFATDVMVSALMKAEEDVVDSPMELDATLYYSDNVIAALSKKARVVARALKKHPGVWQHAFKRDKGREVRTDAALSAEAALGIREIDALLAEVAALLRDVKDTPV